MVSPGRAAKFAQILGLSEKLWIKVALDDQLRADGLKYTVTIDEAALMRRAAPPLLKAPLKINPVFFASCV
jgi:hypothetical protein